MKQNNPLLTTQNRFCTAYWTVNWSESSQPGSNQKECTITTKKHKKKYSTLTFCFKKRVFKLVMNCLTGLSSSLCACMVKSNLVIPEIDQFPHCVSLFLAFRGRKVIHSVINFDNDIIQYYFIGRKVF